MAQRADPCAGCFYRGKAGGNLLCEYILITGHRRPCPFWAGCTVKETEKCMKNWDKAKALALYQAGAIDKEISAEVGVSPTTIYSWRKKNGLEAHGPATQALPAEMIESEDAPGLPPPPGPLEAAAVKVPDMSGPAGTGPDRADPMELHLELCGGWVRLRAPDWQTGQRLLDLMAELIDHVGAMGWSDE